MELIRVRRSLQVAKSIYRILEDKRDVLVRRLNDLVDVAEAEREKMVEPLRQAYASLFKAYAEMGSVKVESVAATTPSSIEVKVSERTVLGIKIPVLEVASTQLPLTYGFLDTTSSFDEAVANFRNILTPICKVAEVENAIFRLAEELKKTQRLLNALEHLIIPRYQEAIKFISANLEEREREDFVKLKHVKKLIERRKEVEAVGAAG
ncbi:MAG: V-type ATP synthase subunit D [Candidatus Caldarchaeum sp.]|nr:V-type ATP synthase subunit D [Candidatus Caldarchaeum sp.]MDW8360287.1 V-type ATP synthase subunit D [Candidatus Caldarchaeum sp.]